MTLPKANDILCSRCHQRLMACEESLSGEIACPHCEHIVLMAATTSTSRHLSAREVYNIVSDIVTGVNFRRRDNLLQLAVIGVSLLLGIVIGAFVVQDRCLGAVVGGFIGLLVGLFGSGMFLMVYRLVRHLLGNHR